MLTNYAWLKSQLESVEGRVTPPASMTFPGAECVRDTHTEFGDNIQTVALDPTTRTSGADLPVVVLIGANYTQNKQPIPRTTASQNRVEEKTMSNCRMNLIESFEHYQLNQDCWASPETKMAPSEKVRLPSLDGTGAFHLVLTNFCLWITTETWLHPSLNGKRASLLKNNPLLDSKPNPGESAMHIHALADVLKEKTVLWVGHGIDKRSFVEPLFRQWIRTRQISEWFFLSNLSDKRNCGKNLERLTRVNAFRRTQNR
ncbi:MAG: hypothetical protein U0640_06725 [Phycisphaerales bacterium]